MIANIQVSSSQITSNWTSFFDTIHERASPCKNLEINADNFAQPLVSVIIVHHNRHLLLKQAIESIEAQTYQNFEVIVVDDGSTDPDAIKYLAELSWQWWENTGWRIIKETNRYLGAARNTGGNVLFCFVLFCFYFIFYLPFPFLGSPYLRFVPTYMP